MKIGVMMLLLVATMAPAQQNGRTHLQSKLARERKLPFSGGVLVGDTLYIAGHTGVDPTTKTPPSLEEEARSAMDQIKGVVEQAGMTMDDVVSIQVFCTDLANYDAFNNVYKTYFHGEYPARAFVGASSLLFGSHFEVMGVAVRRHK